MTIDKPAVALRSIVVVHPTCPARCILPAISRAGNQTTRDAHERSHPRVFFRRQYRLALSSWSCPSATISVQRIPM